MPINNGTYIPLPGDFALVRRSNFPVYAQWAIGKETRYSHVLLNVTGNLWCEAMPLSGVRIVSTAEAFSLSAPAGNTKIFRPPAIPQRNNFPNPLDLSPWMQALSNNFGAWVVACMYYVGQKYNLYFLLRKFGCDKTKSCAELVAAIYRDLGIRPFTDRPTSSWLPADLEQCCTECDWDCYMEAFTKFLYACHSDSPLELGFSNEASRGDLLKRLISTGLRIEIFIRNQIRGARGIEKLCDLIDKGECILNAQKADHIFQKGAPWLLRPEARKQIAIETRKLSRGLRDARNHIS
jgi:hypothetical protein